jgi:hypothetical protein
LIYGFAADEVLVPVLADGTPTFIPDTLLPRGKVPPVIPPLAPCPDVAAEPAAPVPAAPPSVLTPPKADEPETPKLLVPDIVVLGVVSGVSWRDSPVEVVGNI